MNLHIVVKPSVDAMPAGQCVADAHARPQFLIRWRHWSLRSVVLVAVIVMHLAVLVLLRLNPLSRVSISDPVEVRLIAEPSHDIVPALAIPKPSYQLPAIESPAPDIQVQTSQAITVEGSDVPVAIPAESTPPTSAVLPKFDVVPFLDTRCPFHPAPAYPLQAKRLREQGEVTLRVMLDEAGVIRDINVQQSSGSPRLDSAGVAAIRSWRCQPALRDDKAVQSTAIQTFEFVLNRR